MLHEHFEIATVNAGLSFPSPRCSRAEPDKIIGYERRPPIDLSVLIPGRVVFNARPDVKLLAALLEPLSSAETSLLAALAPLAADLPRDAKRFLNAYRLARCSGSPRPVMALMQAVAFADDDAQAAMRDRLAKGSGELSDVGGPAELVEALKAARAANNGPISIDDARAAAEIARRYALPV